MRIEKGINKRTVHWLTSSLVRSMRYLDAASRPSHRRAVYRDMDRMLRILVAVVLCFTYSACSGRSGKVSAVDSKLPIGSFAPPSPNQTLSGNVIIGGWVIHESGIESVSVYIDRDFALKANCGLDRPDVAQAYPSFTKDMISGWNAMLATNSIRPGVHELLARVCAKDGTQRDFAVPITIVRTP